MKLKQVPKFCQLTIKILVHRVKTLLQLLLRLVTNWVVRGIVIDVRKEDSLRERWLDMFARTAVTVAACTNLHEV